jgi:hypothetical protein
VIIDGVGTAAPGTPFAYSDYADLESDLANLADLIPAGKTATWITEHIARAQAIVDSKLSPFTTVPFTSATLPEVATELVRLKAAFRILRANFVNQEPAISEWVLSYQEEFDALLVGIAEGRIALTPTSAAGSIASTTTDRARVFTTTQYDDAGSAIGDTVGSLENI